jgi:hypothetical protein
MLAQDLLELLLVHGRSPTHPPPDDVIQVVDVMQEIPKRRDVLHE